MGPDAPADDAVHQLRHGLRNRLTSLLLLLEAVLDDPSLSNSSEPLVRHAFQEAKRMQAMLAPDRTDNPEITSPP